MGAAKDPITGCTPSQEAFAQAVASGSSLTLAYRSSYYVSPDSDPATATEAASRTAALPHVSARITQLKAETVASLAKKRGWNLERLVDEAETNLHGAREDRDWSPANSALTMIGKATGLLADTPNAPVAPIQIVFVTRGQENQVLATAAPRVVEQAAETKGLEAGAEPDQPL